MPLRRISPLNPGNGLRRTASKAQSVLVRCPSGRRSTPGKCVYGNVSRVRIPPSPPNKEPGLVPGFLLGGQGGSDLNPPVRQAGREPGAGRTRNAGAPRRGGGSLLTTSIPPSPPNKEPGLVPGFLLVHRALAGIVFWDRVWVALLRTRDKGGAFRDRSSHPWPLFVWPSLAKQLPPGTALVPLTEQRHRHGPSHRQDRDGPAVPLWRASPLLCRRGAGN